MHSVHLVHETSQNDNRTRAGVLMCAATPERRERCLIAQELRGAAFWLT